MDCRNGVLPDYCYVEPNYSDHDGPGGEELASDQHPDHHVQAGEIFIAQVYNAIRGNPELWKSTALLITYDEHGGIYEGRWEAETQDFACGPDIPSGRSRNPASPHGVER